MRKDHGFALRLVMLVLALLATCVMFAACGGGEDGPKMGTLQFTETMPNEIEHNKLFDVKPYLIFNEKERVKVSAFYIKGETEESILVSGTMFTPREVGNPVKIHVELLGKPTVYVEKTVSVKENPPTISPTEKLF